MLMWLESTLNAVIWLPMIVLNNNVMAAELMVVFPGYTTDWCYERALLPRKIRTLG